MTGGEPMSDPQSTLTNSSESHSLRLNYSIPNETEETVITWNSRAEVLIGELK